MPIPGHCPQASWISTCGGRNWKSALLKSCSWWSQIAFWVMCFCYITMSPTGEAGIHADLLLLDPALFCSALLQHTMPWPSYSYIYSPIKHPLTHHRVESCLVAKTCLTLCDPMHCGLPSFSLMGFPGQEYWGWLPFASPEDLPDPGIKPRLLHWPDGFFATEPPGQPTRWRECSAFLTFSTIRCFHHGVKEWKKQETLRFATQIIILNHKSMVLWHILHLVRLCKRYHLLFWRPLPCDKLNKMAAKNGDKHTSSCGIQARTQHNYLLLIEWVLYTNKKSSLPKLQDFNSSVSH